MSKLTLKELEERVAANRKYLLERQRYLYKLAKELGFSAGEAIILQNRNEQLIRELAEERQKGS